MSHAGIVTNGDRINFAAVATVSHEWCLADWLTLTQLAAHHHSRLTTDKLSKAVQTYLRDSRKFKLQVEATM